MKNDRFEIPFKLYPGEIEDIQKEIINIWNSNLRQPYRRIETEFLLSGAISNRLTDKSVKAHRRSYEEYLYSLMLELLYKKFAEDYLLEVRIDEDIRISVNAYPSRLKVRIINGRDEVVLLEAKGN